MPRKVPCAAGSAHARRSGRRPRLVGLISVTSTRCRRKGYAARLAQPTPPARRNASRSATGPMCRSLSGLMTELIRST